jgi:hypothetical protein
MNKMKKYNLKKILPPQSNKIIQKKTPEQARMIQAEEMIPVKIPLIFKGCC